MTLCGNLLGAHFGFIGKTFGPSFFKTVIAARIANQLSFLQVNDLIN